VGCSYHCDAASSSVATIIFQFAEHAMQRKVAQSFRFPKDVATSLTEHYPRRESGSQLVAIVNSAHAITPSFTYSAIGDCKRDAPQYPEKQSPVPDLECTLDQSNRFAKTADSADTDVSSGRPNVEPALRESASSVVKRPPTKAPRFGIRHPECNDTLFVP
jgi:hypothetical protein